MHLSNIFAFTILSASSMMVNAYDTTAVRSPQGFIFDCDSNTCPEGTYQDLCPQCFDLVYTQTTNAIQCVCFDENKLLQEGSTIRDAQNCDSITADSTGTLVCGSDSGLSDKKKKKKGRALGASTPAPTPQFLRTASPSVGPGNFYVDFAFNCVGGTCPSGQYQQFCPRCVINQDSTSPNDPEDSMTCLCFNANGQMLLGASTMWGYENCPKIYVSIGGQLHCDGAGGAQGVRTYGRMLSEIEKS